MNYVAFGGGSVSTKTTIALALVPLTMTVAWLAFRVWDLPIRDMLRRHFVAR